MSAVNILKFGISSPGDTSPLAELKRAGYDPSQILAVIGKTEGNGCVNDFSRTLAAVAWEPLIPKDAITIFSGGTEGVLSPHVTFVVREAGGANTGLVAAVTRTRAFKPHEIGTRTQAAGVADEVGRVLDRPGFGDAKLVLVKCPLLTSAKIDAIKVQGRVPLTTDTYESMALSRYACAVGIEAALTYIKDKDDRHSDSVLDSLDNKDSPIWSDYASCSSGAELEDCHILVLGTSPVPGKIRAISSTMRDAIDATPILTALETIRQEGGEVLQVFAKAEADPSGAIRGRRHTMSTDSDIHGTRHARAAVGGLIAGLTGDTQIYVSGGAEGQGPPGGGSLCVVYRVP
ncbi:ring-opening amidohydrolase [Coniochaeta ligniaria NRRL 30616]|uniref:Cyanuric acid amidohydrolase n=1 Tax=Coniochaeta ligniaria NRRL 30616 TaxID=1408157 RepID=A0A1J7INT8_9PEZI|nr:ring-opening amidohydrolase [Coniochaeta ligniaria NRRL 30616]